MFYIILFQEWTDFLNKKEKLRNIDIIIIKYERDKWLDRHNLILCVLGFGVSLRRNVFGK